MLIQNVNETVAFLREKIPFVPEVGLVLGSGLGALAEELEQAVAIPYGEVPHFERSTAPGHKGRLVAGLLRGKPVLCMQGRFHFYEGYTMKQVTYPVRVMSALGVKTLVLTNACGGLDPTFVPGDLMVVTDHINFMGTNPLIGPNEEEFGPRFPDMTHVYDLDLIALAKRVAQAQGVALKHGVYISYTGPSFETPAEIRVFQQFGGSAVGMSTVPEAIVARHCGLRVMAISCVTNLAAGILDVPLTGDEVIEVANLAGAKFTGLLKAIVGEMQ